MVVHCNVGNDGNGWLKKNLSRLTGLDCGHAAVKQSRNHIT